MNFKDIAFQPTGDISADAKEFHRLCNERGIHLEQAKFLENKVRQKLGNEYVLYLSEESSDKKSVHHLIFITSVVWDATKEKELLKFMSELMYGAGHDGVRAYLYLYSFTKPSEELINYLKWSHI